MSGGIAQGTTIKGNTVVKKVTVPIVAAAYASGDVLGTVTTGLAIQCMREANFGAILQKIAVVDHEKLTKGVDIHFFSESITSQTDNAALTLSDSEFASKWLATASVVTADYKTLANQSVAEKTNLAEPLQATNNQDTIYAVLVASEAITFATSNSLTLICGLLPD